MFLLIQRAEKLKNDKLCNEMKKMMDKWDGVTNISEEDFLAHVRKINQQVTL